MSYFEDVYLVSISSIVPVKSDQFNCYLDLIVFPRSVGRRKQYASLGTDLGPGDSGEILQLPAPALRQTEEVREARMISTMNIGAI